MLRCASCELSRRFLADRNICPTFAAVEGTCVMAGTETAEDWLRGIVAEAFFDELADHANKARMRADGGGTDEIQAELFRFVPGFFVQVVKNFDVVGEEADGDRHHVGAAET